MGVVAYPNDTFWLIDIENVINIPLGSGPADGGQHCAGGGDCNSLASRWHHWFYVEGGFC